MEQRFQVDLSECSQGDILISALGGILTFEGKGEDNSYPYNVSYQFVMGERIKRGDGVRYKDGSVYLNKQLWTDHDIIRMLPKAMFFHSMHMEIVRVAAQNGGSLLIADFDEQLQKFLSWSSDAKIIRLGYQNLTVKYEDGEEEDFEYGDLDDRYVLKICAYMLAYEAYYKKYEYTINTRLLAHDLQKFVDKNGNVTIGWTDAFVDALDKQGLEAEVLKLVKHIKEQ